MGICTLSLLEMCYKNGVIKESSRFFYECAKRRTFRLRAMGALSQVKVLNMPR